MPMAKLKLKGYMIKTMISRVHALNYRHEGAKSDTNRHIEPLVGNVHQYLNSLASGLSDQSLCIQASTSASER